MKAEIISVGTELLLGQIVDTNAAYLAKQLASIGVDLYWISQVGDNEDRLVSLLESAWERSDLIVMTGGLGPTQDDLTREAIARFLGEKMEMDDELEKNLRYLMTSRGYVLSPNNLKQATIIPSAKPLRNPRGSAPGWIVQKDGRIIVAMPGVPGEMYRMWEEEVLPVIQAQAGTCIIHSRTLKVTGLGESFTEHKIKDLLATTNPTIAPYAKEDGVHLRLTAKAQTLDEAKRMIAGLEEKVRAILGDAIYGVDEETPSENLAQLFISRGMTIATMEGVTGGFVANRLTATPEAKTYFAGGQIVVTPEQADEAGVAAEVIPTNGWVSLETAKAMAARAREMTGADMGLGLTGVDGADTSQPQPAGTIYIALDYHGEIDTMSTQYPSMSGDYRQRCFIGAANMIRKVLLKEVESS